MLGSVQRVALFWVWFCLFCDSVWFRSVRNKVLECVCGVSVWFVILFGLGLLGIRFWSVFVVVQFGLWFTLVFGSVENGSKLSVISMVTTCVGSVQDIYTGMQNVLQWTRILLPF